MVKDWTYTDREGNKTDYLAIDYGPLDFIVVNAIQEQQEILEQKETQINELKAQNALLDERLTALEKMLSATKTQDKNLNSNQILDSNEVRLFNNYPNPTQGTTTIGYFLPQTTQNAKKSKPSNCRVVAKEK